jgi:microcystin-dependent protein
MGSPYVGEIRMVGFNFAPVGWAICQGQSLPIDQYDTLFNLIGTTYGGDGQTTFNLPDLQGRLPMHMGTGSGLSSRVIGQNGGVEQVTVTTQQIPGHSHVPNATVSGTAPDPTNNFWGGFSSAQYSDQAPNAQMAGNAAQPAGGSQPHDNMLPFLVINFIISLFGIFPSPT